MLRQLNKYFRLALLVTFVRRCCILLIHALLIVIFPCPPGSLMGVVGSSKTNTTCLSDPDSSRATLTLQMCGNGIVEPGEDCDPGIGVNSTCCDTTTCKFINDAVCDPQSSPCCTGQCSFAPATQVCRPSIDASCDYAEMCNGNSSSCPADKTAPNGIWQRLFCPL